MLKIRSFDSLVFAVARSYIVAVALFYCGYPHLFVPYEPRLNIASRLIDGIYVAASLLCIVGCGGFIPTGHIALTFVSIFGVLGFMIFQAMAYTAVPHVRNVMILILRAIAGSSQFGRTLVVNSERGEVRLGAYIWAAAIIYFLSTVLGALLIWLCEGLSVVMSMHTSHMLLITTGMGVRKNIKSAMGRLIVSAWLVVCSVVVRACIVNFRSPGPGVIKVDRGQWQHCKR